MYIDNKVLFLIAAFTLLATGCSTWSGPRGGGHSTPFEWTAEANTAFAGCLSNRRTQRTELLCEAGILSGARCSEEVEVSYRDAVRLICAQSDARESAGESRPMGREDCERMLAPGGIRADATGSVSVNAASDNPRLQALVAMNPALWQDDQAFCVAITSGYGAPTSGGYAVGGYGTNVPYGNAPVVGVGGYAAAGVGIGGPMMGYVGGGMLGSVGLRPFGVVNNITGYVGGREGGQRMAWVNGVPLVKGTQTVIRIPDAPGTLLTFTCSNGTTFNRTLGRADLGYTVVANSDCGWGEF